MGYERLSAQDAVFLHIENELQPAHVGGLALFEARPLLDDDGRFRLDDARRRIANRLHLVPRFRQKVMFVPLEQGRPVWVDDDRFDLSYHVRLTALPHPGDDEQLRTLFARIQAQLLDRRRPLWELWFVEGVEGDRVAMIQKTHHCLVDGVSGVDVATVLLDLDPDAPEIEPEPWTPEPAPSPLELMVESVIERATEPAELMRSARAALRGPRQVAARLSEAGKALASAAGSAPETPWNVPISPHRRWAKLQVPLEQVKGIKNTFGCSVNDVVLTACTGGLRAFLLGREWPVDELVLKTLVPVSVRSEEEQGQLGNRVSMMTAELPAGEPDPLQRLALVRDHMRAMKESGMAVGADALIRMTNYLPPTVLSIAARLLVRSAPLNLTITNVPGPQFPLYCLGARMLEAYPYVPIVQNQGLVIGVLSYDGQLDFGITGDRDALPDLDELAAAIEREFDVLEAAVASAPAPADGATSRARGGSARPLR